MNNKKNRLLALNKCVINNTTILVNKTKAECEKKGVIFWIPITESDEEILTLLKLQGVHDALRITKTIVNNEKKEIIKTET